MDKQVEIEAKRREVQHEIVELKKKTTAAMLLSFFSTWLPKSLSETSLASWLFRIFILNIVVLLPGFAISFFNNEMDRTIDIWIPWIIGVEAAISALIASHFATQSALDDIANNIVEKINDVESLSKLGKWLYSSWSIRNIYPYVLIAMFAWVVLSTVGISFVRNKFVGLGPMFVTVPTGFLIGASFYYIIWMILLTYQLRNYLYELNVFAPANSEAIDNITVITNRHLYISATFLAFYTLLTPTIQGAALLSPFVWIGWAIITIEYVITRSTIGKIVEKAKWKTLSKLQLQINQIESTGDLSDKETAERLLRLNDIYERIRVSRVTAFDSKSLLNFFSQMMLPLLGLLLANFDKLTTLFR